MNSTTRRRLLVCLSILLSMAAVSVLPLIGQQPRGGEATYDLSHAKAADVAPQLQHLLQESGSQGEVLINRSSNQLLVRGDADVQRIARQLVQTLDRAAAEPMDKQSEVKGYKLPADKLEATAARIRRQFAGRARVTVDARTSQLLIVAAPQVHQELARQLAPQRVDAPGMEPAAPLAAEVRTEPVLVHGGSYKLKNITWRELEDNLKRLWGQRLRLTVERNGELAQVDTSADETAVMRIDRRNDLVVFDDNGKWNGAWGKFVSALDAQLSGEGTTELLPVREADPQVIRRAVHLIQTATKAAAEADQAVAMTRIDPRLAQRNTTSLVHQVPDANQAPAAQNPPAPQDQNQPMPEAPEAAPEAGIEDDGQPMGPIQLQFIPELGIVVVQAKKEDIERVRGLIQRIAETSKMVEPQVELLPLKFVNAEQLSTVVVGMYDQVFAARQGPLSITPLDKPNALVLIGSQATIDVVKKLVAQLDQPVSPESQLKVFRLEHVSAVDAERTVREFFTDIPGGTGATGNVTEERLRTNLGTRLRLISDYRSNSLIVQAAPGDMAEVAYLIQLIDVPSTEAGTELRVFRLRNALAAELAPVLLEAITGQSAQQQQQLQQGQGTATQLTKPSGNITIIGVDAAGNKIIEGDIFTDVTITADANVNAVLVRAPSSSMGLISELIRQLDQLPDAEAQIKVFQIENGDATNLTAMLQSLFGLPVTAGQGFTQQALGQLGTSFGTAAGAGESSLIALNFAVDVRTNSIIVSGSPGDLRVVEALLLRLDEGEIETRRTVVYRLRHAPALDVANSISTFLQSQRAINQAVVTFQAVSPYEQIEREVIVVPELVTNSLIVSATPRYFDDIMAVIRDLDFRKPMVMVQVVIAEVQLDDSFEFGVELGLQDSLLYDRSVASAGTNLPGFNFNNQSLGNSNSAAALATREKTAGQALSSFLLGRSSAGLGYGGMVLSAASESVNILIRALQDSGRIQVLSRPQIMALDNQPAFLQVGARVPRITGGTTTPQGGTSNTTTDENVGLLLRIQPRINEDGLVVLDVDVERSEVGPIEDGIPVSITENGQVINSPQINTTTAQTTLSAFSGQTIVFAGLIQKFRVINSRRIPYLSDVPVLGRLFRFDAESEERRELLILMTPHIVDEYQDSDWINQVESARMSWCLADVVEMHGDVGLSGGNGLWGPATSPVIYPDQAPTVDAIPGLAPRSEVYPSGALPAPVQSAPAQSTRRGQQSPVPAVVPGTMPRDSGGAAPLTPPSSGASPMNLDPLSNPSRGAVPMSSLPRVGAPPHGAAYQPPYQPLHRPPYQPAAPHVAGVAPANYAMPPTSRATPAAFSQAPPVVTEELPGGRTLNVVTPPLTGYGWPDAASYALPRP